MNINISKGSPSDGKIEKRPPKCQGGRVQRKLDFQWGNEQLAATTRSCPPCSHQVHPTVTIEVHGSSGRNCTTKSSVGRNCATTSRMCAGKESCGYVSVRSKTRSILAGNCSISSPLETLKIRQPRSGPSGLG